MGDGQISECCHDVTDGNRCSLCGKFCHIEVCMDCNGQGFTDFHIGDEVEIFVCVWSPQYLIENLYKVKNCDDSKFFRGKITKLIDDRTVEVKVNRKLLNIGIDEIISR